jgi:hypothetical protein
VQQEQQDRLEQLDRLEHKEHLHRKNISRGKWGYILVVRMCPHP